MTSAAQDVESQLAAEMRALEDAVATIRSADDLKDKKAAEREARKIWRTAKATSNALRRQVNAIEDPTQKSVYTRKFDEHTKKITAYDAEMRMLINPRRGKNVVSSDQAAFNNIMGDAGDLNDAGKVMRAAVRAQDDNLAILENIQREAMATEETGVAIAEKLAQDTEKIREIDKELNSLQANIDRAKNEVGWFARQMATDKCFLVLIVVVVLGLCMLTFWKIYKGRKGSPVEAPQVVERTVAPVETPAPPPETSAEVAKRMAHALARYALTP